MTQNNNNPPIIDYRSPAAVPKKQLSAKRVVGWTIAALCFGACILSILLPSQGRARESANRVKCASNLRQIGQAILIYANDNYGRLPPDLATVLATQDITAEVFVCPSHDLEKAIGPTTQQVINDMLTGDHLSYAYVALPNSAWLTMDNIIAFDLDPHVPKDSAKGTGINVLLGDGSAVFVDEKAAKAILARYYAGVRPIKLSECDPAAKPAALPATTTN